ncbi:MAG: hypothetical protein IKY23_05780 [Lachnospiraceae bacterium]|nr:hypothetical protein [Lachnospiraceae bacterium]
MTEGRKNFEDAFGKIQQAMDRRDFDTVVRDCCGLFEAAFKKIYQEACSTLDFKTRQELMSKEAEIGKGNKGVNDFGFGELVGLYRETGLLKKWAKATNRDLGLIDSINYNSIVALRNKLSHPDYESMGKVCSIGDADLVYNYVKNLYATLGLFSMDEGIKAAFEAKTTTTVNGEEREMVNIALIRERGIIINQSDESRNVSYKVDTINRMLSVVYKKTCELADEKTAEKMLFDMGYDSGNAFGNVMNERWETNNITYEDKFKKWCDFDSEVGWGRFNSTLTVDEEEGKIDGTLEIKENFLCHGRKKNDVKICSFMKGYCEGVIEELLGGQPVTLVCVTEQCPLKNAFKKTCKYRVDIGDEE